MLYVGVDRLLTLLAKIEIRTSENEVRQHDLNRTDNDSIDTYRSVYRWVLCDC